MRGNFIHNRVLLEPIESHFRRLRALVYLEYPTRMGRQAGFIDLFILHGPHRIACEAELSPDRVRNDVVKARAVHATLLLIVSTNVSVVRTIDQRLRSWGPPEVPQLRDVPALPIWVLPLGRMLQRLAINFPLGTGLNVPLSSGPLVPQCPHCPTARQRIGGFIPPTLFDQPTPKRGGEQS